MQLSHGVCVEIKHLSALALTFSLSLPLEATERPLTFRGTFSPVALGRSLGRSPSSRESKKRCAQALQSHLCCAAACLGEYVELLLLCEVRRDWVQMFEKVQS